MAEPVEWVAEVEEVEVSQEAVRMVAEEEDRAKVMGEITVKATVADLEMEMDTKGMEKMEVVGMLVEAAVEAVRVQAGAAMTVSVAGWEAARRCNNHRSCNQDCALPRMPGVAPADHT
mmetsp:Transcript_40461/g.107136  ORF Transcript_40461/g.107136 Transcript_40461/m.107136 type:complete len:118 (+) Transcript_40461:967-1320(+)